MSTETDQDSSLAGDPTILVVDDEELMREVTSIMIEDNGGEAITAVDGVDAVEVFQKHSDSIDVIFLDFSMPGMNGYEAYLKIRELSSEVSFVMVSGLTVTEEIRKLEELGQVLFLAKPFHEHELISALNQVRELAIFES